MIGLRVLLGLSFSGIISCTTTTQVSPKPNVQPIVVSNAATQKSIGDSRTHIKKTKVILQQQGKDIDLIEDDLSNLLKWIWLVPK